MAQAIGDPEEIRSFSNTLEHYLNTVEEETGRLNSAFEQLGESWQDQQRASFEETYKYRVMRHDEIREIIKKLGQYELKIKKKCK